MKTPRVSIGVPVRNGGRMLAATLDSLLAQSFTDFEIILVDNASIDGTAKIAEAFAARDSRIKYTRNLRNFGRVSSFNRCVDLARGEYFRWHFVGDRVDREHLAACVAALDGNLDASLAFTGAHNDGQRIPPLITPVAPAVKRFASIVMIPRTLRRHPEFFGLMRTSMLRETALLNESAEPESVLLAELALAGPFVADPEALLNTYSCETQPATGVNMAGFDQLLRRFVGPIAAGRLPTAGLSQFSSINFPHWRVLKNYALALLHRRVSMADRFAGVGVLALWALTNADVLLADILAIASATTADCVTRLSNDARVQAAHR